MATDDRHSGTLRTDYETDSTQPNGLQAMESSWQRLLHRLVCYSSGRDYREDDGQEGTLVPLLENHVLTVVADIMRKRLSGYGESFADAQGTVGEKQFYKKLEKDIKGWIERLEAFIDKGWRTGLNESPAGTVAIQIRDSLKRSLPVKDEAKKHGYYRMLRTVKSIQEHADYYLEQIEASGDVDGALSLLVAYLKNYCSIADTFNQRLSELHTLYQKEVLHVKPSKVVQDNAYIVVRPTEICTLKSGQGFLAGQNAEGEDLVYRTNKAETVSPLQCTEVDAVYSVRDDTERTTCIRRQTIRPEDAAVAETLFEPEQGEALAFGWQIESSMFILNEGEREVNISLGIRENTIDLLSSCREKIEGFTFHLSSADGWVEQKGECFADGGRLCFRFTIERDGTLPTACNGETHGKDTAYPVLRILTYGDDGAYDRVSEMEIGEAEIRVHVGGIRNFTFYNELGEVDTTQPFQPFGIQAECGAWFLFGNEEMGLKHLTEVHIKGVWQKMPETEKGFNDLYRGYAVDASSFKVNTEWQEKGKWKSCEGDAQSIFKFDEKGELCPADVCFDFSEQPVLLCSVASRYEYSRDKDGFFRATLCSPSIGFCGDEYRKQFTDIMIYNSRCKEKQQKKMPLEPVNPILSDVELEYSSVQTLTDIPKAELFVSSNFQETCFKSRMNKEEYKSLYFAFVNAGGLQSLRMYMEMVISPRNIPYNMPKTNGNISLGWEYRKENAWEELSSKAVTVEETCGFTQSGFIEIKLPEKIADKHIDRDGKMWLRATLKGDTDSCLAIRGIWTNCMLLTAQNGEGAPLAAGTIKDMQEPDGRIVLISQPLSGFGGNPADTDNHLSSHLRARFNTRHRAVNLKDYEQIVLEHFPEVDKAVCIPCTEKGTRLVRLVVFSADSDSVYYLSPSWKLKEIERALRQYAPPFVRLEVTNPVYEEIKVVCKAVLREDVIDSGKVVRNLVVLAQNYLAPWKRKGLMPDLQQTYSYKELHARMANHEDLQTVAELTVGSFASTPVDFDSSDYTIKGNHPYSVLIPKIEIILLSPNDGIETTEIGSSFIIK